MSERVYCAEAEPREPLAGTADPVDVWILIEYRPTWRARAHDDNELPPEFRAWLAAGSAALGAQGLRARPQFIRQPTRSGLGVRLLLGTPAGLFEHDFADYSDLQGFDLVTAVMEPAVAPIAAPHYFVCTNGQRDVCCARFGLPVFEALTAVAGERVWQVTHLGGHRFAPNVLVLPQRALYGRVTPDAVPAFLETAEAGRLAFPLLRGRTSLPRAAQAAEVFIGLDDLALESVSGDDNHAEVAFSAPSGPVRISVARDVTPLSVLPSCGAEPEDVRPYRAMPSTDPLSKRS